MPETTPGSALVLHVIPGNERVESASPFCVKVARGLNYKGLPFVTEYRGKAVKALVNPLGKLPVLEYRRDLVADSTAILNYIEKLHPDRSLLPEGRQATARARILEDWADQSLYFYLMYLRWLVQPNWLRYREAFIDPAPRALKSVLSRRKVQRQLKRQGIGQRDYHHVFGELRQILDDLDCILEETPFLVGDHLTIADLAVFAMVGGLCVGPTPDGERLVTERESLWAYVQRVDEMTRERST